MFTKELILITVVAILATASLILTIVNYAKLKKMLKQIPDAAKTCDTTTRNKHPFNPFNIPDLDPMLEAVTKWVKDNQGDKGFILTDNTDNDTIWAILYSEEDGYAIEAEVKAVRVSEYGKLEAMCDTSSVTYNDEWVKEAENPNKSLFHSWLDLKWDENLYFIPTIFNIAENIREYA